MDQLRALRVFRAVADAKGLARAARALSMTPPTVTRIVNDLEAHLGTPLLTRTTRSVSLTETGAAYLAEARRILEDVEAADDAARGARVTPSGRLRVTASVLFGQYYVAPILRDYLDRYPDVSAEALFVDRLVNVIDEGFDIAVRIGPLPDSGLRAIRVGEVRHVICGSPDYFAANGKPDRPEALAEHRVIDFTGAGQASGWRFGDRRPVRVRSRLKFSTIAPCIDAARSGWGLTRVLSYQVGPELAAGTLETVLDDANPERWPVNLVHVAERRQSAKLRSFLELAVARLRDEPQITPAAK